MNRKKNILNLDKKVLNQTKKIETSFSKSKNHHKIHKKINKNAVE